MLSQSAKSALSQQDVQAYRNDGVLAPLRVLDAAGAASLRAKYEQAEARSGLPADWHDNPHLLFAWARELVCHPQILDAVEQLIGPDILCWEVDSFVKEAGSPTFVSWHQDITYWGLEADRVVTAWVALTPSTQESGCLSVVPGSHLHDLLPHIDTYGTDNMLSRGQTIASIDPGTARHLELQPGECSFHHVKIVHGSGANRSHDRRMGLAIRYMAPSVRPLHDRGDFATLVRGRDTWRHFLPLPLPTDDLDIALHRRVNDHRDRLVMPEPPQSAQDQG